MNTPDIYSYVKTQESDFQSSEKRIGENWNWNFRTHVQMIFHLKHGVFYTGENDWLRAFKNIMQPIIDLSNWTEDLEAKDVTIFIEDEDGRALSFLIKKYHDEVYVREHDLDTLFDSVTESDNTYGGVLVERGYKEPPKVFSLVKIAFCDQTDMMGGPIGVKHSFSPTKLKAMSKYGWGKEENGATISIEELIVLADECKDVPGTTGGTNESTGKTIEVYIVRGDLPESYLYNEGDEESYCGQVQILAFYTDKKGQKQGVTLYRKKEYESNFEFFTSSPVENRALGYGVGEALLHPQIWTNFLTIHKTNMLESASKIPLYTDDPTYTQKNKIQDMENLEITTIEDNKRIFQVPTAAPANIQVLQSAINEWQDHGQLVGAAFDPLLGMEQSAGTTFRGQERTVAQGKGSHERKRGKRAKFIEKLYRTDIIPQIVDELRNGKKFLATLSTDEMSWLSDQLATNYVNKRIKEAMLNWKDLPSKEEQEVIKQTFKEDFQKRGNKKMLEILSGELEGIETRIGINIGGKQKDLVNVSDKILSIFQAVLQNPQAFQQAMQIPALAKSFQTMIEFGGLSQSDFVSLTAPVSQAQPAPQQVTQATA